MKRLFNELPFYGVSTEKTCTKHLNNIDMLYELPFYDELDLAKTSKAFKRIRKD